MIKTVSVVQDEFTQIASTAFDYSFDGTSMFKCWDKPNVPDEFNIGVIVGASGTGKSTLLKEFGNEEIPLWDQDKAIVSHFDSPEDAIDKLTAVGLNSIPSWCRPYHVLSTGEKFRADLARKLKDNSVIDEFTSVVDRNVAKAASTALSKYIRNNNIRNIILATCHEDILEWLEPDWVFNTNNGELLVGRCLQRPKIIIEIYPCKRNIWAMFKNYHYLRDDLNKSSRCFIAVWDSNIVGFASSIAMPSGTVKNAWREHRTVILPDYQGMGIGTQLSDTIAQIHINEGKRYFSRTAHPRMGEHRDNVLLWKKTSKYKKLRTDAKNVKQIYNKYYVDTNRVCYSHEYIGEII